MGVVLVACSGGSASPDADVASDPDAVTEIPDEPAVDPAIDPVEEIDPLLITDLAIEENPNSVLTFWVTWSTNRPASSTVEYGEDTSYASSRGTDDLVLDHRVLVVGCPAETDVHLRAASRDAEGLEATSPDTVHTTGSLPDWFPELDLDVPDTGEAQPGVTLMNISHGTVDLPTLVVYIDMLGRIVWYWLSEGLEKRSGIATSRVENGDVLVGANAERPWIQVDLAGDEVHRGTQPEVGEGRVHHEVVRLVDGTTAVIRGWRAERAPDDLFSYDTIDVFETATETSLWTWSTLDHLPHPPAPISDWTHANSVTVDPVGRVAYLNVRNLELILKIDMDSGEILWMLGIGDGGDFALGSGGWFFHCHDPEILPGDRILVYDNGNARPGGNYSRAVEYELDPVTMSAVEVWQYDGPPGWYTPNWGDADRLENGNTLITAGARDGALLSRVFEVAPDGTVVWSVTLPEYYGVYRAERYASIDAP